MLYHLTQRVAWHDSGWKPCVCQDPVANAYCTYLPRIREGKQDAEEHDLQSPMGFDDDATVVALVAEAVGRGDIL